MTKTTPFAHRRRAAFASWLFALGSPAMAENPAFESRQAAEDYLARTLPMATAANPKYFAQSEGVESVWLTKSVRFDAVLSGVRIAMDEAYTQTKAGVTTPGTHQTAFSLADVDITLLTSPTDVTPGGEPSMGLLFTCAKPGCISASWNGQAGPADKTDISLQDPAVRERVLAAFSVLEKRRKTAGVSGASAERERGAYSFVTDMSGADGFFIPTT